MYKEKHLVDTIKTGRLRWTGHAMRSQNSLVRAVLDQNPIGKRPLGRPKMRWEDIVKMDVEELGGRPNWKGLAMNIDGWRIGYETGWS